MASKFAVRSSSLVKASNHSEYHGKESSLCCFDTMMPPFRFHVWFFYNYKVQDEQLLRALEATLNRYPELSGRIDLEKEVVNLTNEGAQVQFLDTAVVSLSELKSRGFDYKLCVENFHVDDQLMDEYLLKVVVCRRTEVNSPSGKEPIFEHPEFTIIPDDVYKQGFATYLQDMMINERKAKILKIDPESLRKLKQDVYTLREQSKLKDVEPSSNDCLISLLFRAYAIAGEVETSGNPGNVLPLQIACNSRFRRNPKVPVTYFGNMIVNIDTPWSLDYLKSETMFDTAAKIRNRVLTINHDFVQSTIDKISMDKTLKFASMMYTTRYSVTNWNHPEFEWYKAADLGSGGPEKFTMLTKFLDQFSVMVPSKDGGLEVLTAAKAEIMDKFLSDPLIDKYFSVAKEDSGSGDR
ncbi:uncharacterized protein LOC142342714 isoform X2 [Convolutriloba macropyga]|uniref:uncharacterized protein LOC142342714 isoform X2 n=1 Tax=Convolutriloba macropyga TaxID=536237 RepID=UPI003F52331F